MIDRETVKSKIDKLYKFSNDNIQLSVKEYFLTFKDTLPCHYRFENISSKIIEDFEKNGWKRFLFVDVVNKDKHNNEESYYSLSLDDNYYNSQWIKDDFFMSVTLVGRKDKCNIGLGFPFDQSQEKIEKEYNFINSYRDLKVNSKFYILIRDEIGLCLKDFKVNLPKNVDFELNYGEGFNKIHENIKNKLMNEDSGLFIFHGDAGCGKSTYIKKLAEEIPDKKFVYVPEFMIGLLNNPELISLFISNQNSILVIEDAEKLIMSRESDNSSLVSIVLNISDGILSDILKIPVILTYNTKTENIDNALLRKGRLKYKHEFKKLKQNEIVKVLKTIGLTDKDIKGLKSENKIEDEMSLADIYFLYDNIGLTKIEKPSSFGFK
jgi:hypothetical protein